MCVYVCACRSEYLHVVRKLMQLDRPLIRLIALIDSCTTLCESGL